MRKVVIQKMKYALLGVVITSAIGVAMVKMSLKPTGVRP